MYCGRRITSNSRKRNIAGKVAGHIKPATNRYERITFYGGYSAKLKKRKNQPNGCIINPKPKLEGK